MTTSPRSDDASSNPARYNEFIVVLCSVRLVFHISQDGSKIELKHCASSKTSADLNTMCENKNLFLACKHIVPSPFASS